MIDNSRPCGAVLFRLSSQISPIRGTIRDVGAWLVQRLLNTTGKKEVRFRGLCSPSLLELPFWRFHDFLLRQLFQFLWLRILAVISVLCFKCCVSFRHQWPHIGAWFYVTVWLLCHGVYSQACVPVPSVSVVYCLLQSANLVFRGARDRPSYLTPELPGCWAL